MCSADGGSESVGLSSWSGGSMGEVITLRSYSSSASESSWYADLNEAAMAVQTGGASTAGAQAAIVWLVLCWGIGECWGVQKRRGVLPARALLSQGGATAIEPAP